MAQKDILEEARVIKSIMDSIGWSYVTGGPYPFEPTMKFKRNGETLKISLTKES